MHRVEMTADGGIRLRTSSNESIERTKADVQGRMAVGDRSDMAKVAAAMQAELQSALDVRQRIFDLPNDDPDKTTDPKRPDLFWDGADLVGRAETVTVAWDGVQFIPTVTRV